jgi:hypothetical protein
MSKATNAKKHDKDTDTKATNESGMEELRRSPMMAHLLDALEKGTDIGHYGRLTFVTVTT